MSSSKKSSNKKQQAPLAKSDIGSPTEFRHMIHLNFGDGQPQPNMVARNVDGNTVYVDKDAAEMISDLNIGNPILTGDERGVDVSPTVEEQESEKKRPEKQKINASPKTSLSSSLKGIFWKKKKPAPLPPTSGHENYDKSEQQKMENQLSSAKSENLTNLSFLNLSTLTLDIVDENIKIFTNDVKILRDIRSKMEKGETVSLYDTSGIHNTLFDPNVKNQKTSLTKSINSLNQPKEKRPAPPQPTMSTFLPTEPEQPTNAENVSEVNQSFDFQRRTDEDNVYNCHATVTSKGISKVTVSRTIKTSPNENIYEEIKPKDEPINDVSMATPQIQNESLNLPTPPPPTVSYVKFRNNNCTSAPEVTQVTEDTPTSSHAAANANISEQNTVEAPEATVPSKKSVVIKKPLDSVVAELSIRLRNGKPLNPDYPKHRSCMTSAEATDRPVPLPRRIPPKRSRPVTTVNCVVNTESSMTDPVSESENENEPKITRF